MFPYFGSKKTLAKYYSPPLHDTIIEPFAGAAGYAIHHATPDHRVILIDKNPEVVQVWKFLQQATPAQILDLPIVQPGERISDYGYLEDVERKLISFFTASCAHPHINNDGVYKFSRWNESHRAALATRLDQIRNWEIILGTYDDAPNVTATWFIDPPYQSTAEEIKSRGAGAAYGPKYGVKALDFTHLSEFVHNRQGQIIVAERTTATWLPFQHLRTILPNNVRRAHTYTEGVYEA